MDWHPLIVHYPIALLPLSAGVDLLAWWRGKEDGHHLAYGLLVLGTVGALAAVLSGNAAAAPHWQTPLAEKIHRHEDLATATLFLCLAIVLGRLPLHLRGPLQGWPLKAWIAAAAWPAAWSG